MTQTQKPYRIVYAKGTSIHDEKHYGVRVAAEKLAERIAYIQKSGSRIIRVIED